MNSPLEDEEREHFSDRLKQAILAAGYNISPTKFAAEFNLRADGVAVTVHGARKWLTGEAIPTQARITVMADWLGVSPAWLRFGEAGNSGVHTSEETGFKLRSDELLFVHDMRLLSGANKLLMRGFLDVMLRAESAKLGASTVSKPPATP